MLGTILAIISLTVAIIGLIVQFIAVGIYIGKLEGFKDFVSYRFSQQDKRLDSHNNFITRVYELEKKDGVREEQISVANHRIKDLEEMAGTKK